MGKVGGGSMNGSSSLGSFVSLVSAEMITGKPQDGLSTGSLFEDEDEDGTGSSKIGVLIFGDSSVTICVLPVHGFSIGATFSPVSIALQ